MSNYYEKRNAKVNIAHELMNNGWKVFGYKADESDSMTDYYSPANWDGIATKNGFTLVVDTKYTGNSGRVQTRTTTSGSANYKKISKLEKMTIENGCTEAEAQAAQDMINKLKNSVKTNEEIISVWPEFMANPKGCIWHIEKEGAIVAKGRALTIFADVPESYMFDIKTMKFKGSWKTVRDWNGNTYDRELNEKEAKAVKSFKEFLNKIESVVAVKIGEEQEEDQLVKVTEEKTTIKKEKIQVNRENELQVGDIVHVDSSTGYVKILEVFEGHYNTIKVSGRTWKESKSRFAHVNLNKQSFDRSLQRGYLKVYNIVEVEEVTTVEKWVKAKKETKKSTNKKYDEATTEVEEAAEGKKVLYSNEEIQIIEAEKTTRIYFSGKPSEEIRNNIKALGFRFFKNDGFYWGIYTNKTTLEAIKAALQIEIIEQVEEVTEVKNIKEKIQDQITFDIYGEGIRGDKENLTLEELEKEFNARVEDEKIYQEQYGKGGYCKTWIIVKYKDIKYKTCRIDLIGNENLYISLSDAINDLMLGLKNNCSNSLEYYFNSNNFNKCMELIQNLLNLLKSNTEEEPTERKENTLEVIEGNTKAPEEQNNVERINNIYAEVEALEKRLKLVKSDKLKYKLQDQINNKMKEIAKIILSDELLYMQFMKESKE